MPYLNPDPNFKFNFAYKYGVMISSTKKSTDKNDTQRLFAKIKKVNYSLICKFPDLVIPPVLYQQQFGVIFYSHENQLCPIIQYLKKNISKQFRIRHKHRIIDKFHEPSKQLQCVA